MRNTTLANEDPGHYSFGRMLMMTGSLAGPAIVSNVTVPLLGLSDTFITGHLGSGRYIAAISVGTMMVNAIYWLCGFLRMGTSGLTAESYGMGDIGRRRRILTVSLYLALAIGCAMILVSPLLCRLMLGLMDPPEATAGLARDYFIISIFGSPAILATMAVSGWMVGSQNTLYPMIIAISVNVINIIVSFSLVFGLDSGFTGVAYGTLAANWSGLILAVILARRLIGEGGLLSSIKGLTHGLDLGRFFKVNGNLFVRSACLMSVSFAMTSYAGRMGETALAVNAILMQFFLFFSYFMDGFAFGGEALCGRFAGAREVGNLNMSVKALSAWSAIVTVFFTIVYLLFTPDITAVLTDVEVVRAGVFELRGVAWLLPVISVAAFMFDGVYIGLTDTSRMMVATMAGAVVFFGLHYTFAGIDGLECLSEAGQLWICFMSFLLMRGLILGSSLRGAIHKSCGNH